MIKKRKIEVALSSTSSYMIRGVATALSALHIGGRQSGGTIRLFNREKVRCTDGKIRELPVVPGNSVRGLLRDSGMYFMLRELGFAEEDAVKLAPAPFDFLTSGGALSKEAGRGIDFGLRRRIREIIPLAGVFGGATGRHIMEGKLQIGKWYPISSEFRHLLPVEYQDHPDAQESVFNSLDIQFGVRKDDKKSEKWQVFLPPAQVQLLEAPKTKLTKSGDEIAEKPGVATQMIYDHEVLIAGTHLYYWINLEYVTNIEFEAFLTALAQWRIKPIIGGKGSVGLGLVEVNFDDWLHVVPNMTLDGSAVGLPIGQEYMEHIRSRKDDILQLLREIG